MVKNIHNVLNNEEKGLITKITKKLNDNDNNNDYDNNDNNMYLLTCIT